MIAISRQVSATVGYSASWLLITSLSFDSLFLARASIHIVYRESHGFRFISQKWKCRFVRLPSNSEKCHSNIELTMFLRLGKSRNLCSTRWSRYYEACWLQIAFLSAADRYRDLCAYLKVSSQFGGSTKARFIARQLLNNKNHRYARWHEVHKSCATVTERLLWWYTISKCGAVSMLAQRNCVHAAPRWYAPVFRNERQRERDRDTRREYHSSLSYKNLFILL